MHTLFHLMISHNSQRLSHSFFILFTFLSSDWISINDPAFKFTDSFVPLASFCCWCFQLHFSISFIVFFSSPIPLWFFFYGFYLSVKLFMYCLPDFILCFLVAYCAPSKQFEFLIKQAMCLKFLFGSCLFRCSTSSRLRFSRLYIHKNYPFHTYCEINLYTVKRNVVSKISLVSIVSPFHLSCFCVFFPDLQLVWILSLLL